MSTPVLLASHLFLIFLYLPSVCSFKIVHRNENELPLPLNSWSIQDNNVDIANLTHLFYTTIVDGLGNNAGQQTAEVGDDTEKFRCGISSWDPPLPSITPVVGPSNHIIHGFQVIFVERNFVAFFRIDFA
jgi:hypothetical protein